MVLTNMGHCGLKIATDDHENIFEVMGDSPRQAGDGFHLLGIAQPTFSLKSLINLQ